VRRKGGGVVGELLFVGGGGGGGVFLYLPHKSYAFFFGCFYDVFP